MFKVSKDIEEEMQLLHPEIAADIFIDQLLSKIINKTLDCGASSIRNLGKFVAFQVYSSRLNKNVIRLKFQISLALINKIKFDELLMAKLPIKSLAKYDERNEQKCSKVRHRKVKSEVINKEVSKSERENTKQNLGKIEIMKILNNKD